MQAIKERYNKTIKNICYIFSSPVMISLSFLLYKIIVDSIYVLFMRNDGRYGINISILNILSGYLAVILFSYFIYKFCQMETASSLIMIAISMVYFIPLITFCSFGPGSNGTFFWTIFFWFIMSLLQIKLPIISFSFKRKKEYTSNTFFYILLFCMTGLTIFISLKYTGGRIITHMNNIYEIRAEAATYDFPIWLSYLQRFSNILIPMLVLMSFEKKKYMYGIFAMLLLFLNFSFAGHKTILFMGVLLITGYFFWKKEMIYLIVPGGSLLGILGIIEKVYFQKNTIISLFFRRQGFVLAELTDYYYRFFKQNPTDLFRSTFLGKLGFNSPYSLQLPNVIGNNYLTQNITCNNGLLADVWSHLGISGILIIPIILLVCFRVYDLATDGLNSKCFIGLSIYYAIIYANTTWSTVVLTHGFLIMCVMFLVFPRNISNDRVKK